MSQLHDVMGNGRCCCNCEYQHPVVAHPDNKTEFAKGSVTKTIGWGCKPADMDFTAITFFETEHGLCELHDFKKQEG